MRMVPMPGSSRGRSTRPASGYGRSGAITTARRRRAGRTSSTSTRRSAGGGGGGGAELQGGGGGAGAGYTQPFFGDFGVARRGGGGGGGPSPPLPAPRRSAKSRLLRGQGPPRAGALLPPRRQVRAR